MTMLTYLCLCLIGANAAPTASEIDAQLDAVRRQCFDVRRPVEQRVSIALEEAASLDKLAQTAETPAERRHRAFQGITLLDDLNAANPGHSLQVPVAIQAAVYLWADGRREFDEWQLAPKDESLKNRSREVLDSSISRFERIEPALSGADPLVAQNARFRLAQALTDRSRIEPHDSDTGKSFLRRALSALEPIPSETAVVGFARCLRAEVRARLGDSNAAEDELEQASKAKILPPPESLLEIQTLILCGQRRFSAAIKAIDESKIDPTSRAVLGIRVRLSQRRAQLAGQERRDADEDALNRARILRGSSRIDSRLAIIDLAREIDLPPTRSEPDAWSLLADGAIGLGDFSRASRLLELGADRAINQGNREEAGRLRLRAGAVLFQNDDYGGADGALTVVWKDPKSGPSRPKAGMLRVLARGRMLSANTTASARSKYVEAMEELVLAYPTDPTANEARWLLGLHKFESGQFDEARRHWEAISTGTPRWLAARLAIAEQSQRELDSLRIAADPNLLAARYGKAAAFLRDAISAVPDSTEAAELELAAIRLNLTAGIGRPDLARSLCDRVTHHSGSEEQHDRARLLRVVALAQTQRFPEAEHEARIEGPRALPENLLLAAKLLDHSADASESDANRSRLGRILQVLLQAGFRHFEKLTGPAQAEFRLRTIRAEIAVGDSASARRSLAGPHSPAVAELDNDGLRDLADGYMRIEAYGMAIDVERILARKLTPGTPAWIESRYVLALALYKTRKPQEARRMIDATTILHTDLGGGTLKSRFERLRQRIEPD